MLGRDELAVGEHLEITIRMLGEDVEQALVHEGFAAEDAEKAVAGLAGLADEPVQMIRLDLLLFRRHIHPAALTAEVAGIQNRYVEERREIFAALQPGLKPLHTPHAAPTKVVGKLPEQTFVCLQNHPTHHGEVHGR